MNFLFHHLTNDSIKNKVYPANTIMQRQQFFTIYFENHSQNKAAIVIELHA